MSKRRMPTICIFCAANDVGEVYVKDTQEFARLMVEHRYNLVWGGSNRGLMKVLADSVQGYGGKLIGVSVEFLRQWKRENVNEMIITKDLSERKATLMERGDAIVLLVGGIGSLDEITEILEHKKHGHHNKPIVVLNTNGFYAGLKLQLERMKQEGFITAELDTLIHFASTPQEAIMIINYAIAAT